MKDRNYHRQYSKNYYHKRRNELIQKLGGKCVVCGSTENLEFDHIDATTKEYNISEKLLSYSINSLLPELEKCQLLCHKCHSRKSKIDISSKNSGSNNYFYGKHGSDFPSSKPVIDLDTGKEYESATDYALAHNLDRNSVTRMCRGERKSLQGHHAVYK